MKTVVYNGKEFNLITVRDLIEKLSEYPDDLPVTVDYYMLDYNDFTFIDSFVPFDTDSTDFDKSIKMECLNIG